MIRLERANVIFKDSFLEAAKEARKYSSNDNSTKWYDDLDFEELESNFADYVASVTARERGECLPEGYVPETFFWIIDEMDQYVGRISLRHELSDSLKKIGGHIGYDIIPSSRKKGYAMKALELCLKEAITIGLDEVMLTCDEYNKASEKVIKNNGGVLRGEIKLDNQSYITKQYFIKLK